jgi:hypothetical protein
MVPVESSFEVEFAPYFVDQSRKFLKPNIVDEISDDGNRPDFILLDTPMHFARFGACKLRRIGLPRTSESQATQLSQTFVSWDASERKPFPNLPRQMLLFSVRRVARRGLHAHLGTIP